MAEGGWGTGPFSGLMGRKRFPCEQPYEQIYRNA
jgi:hypothetical protein